MKTTARKIEPDEFILSALKPEDRLDAALKIAKVAFSNSRLTMEDIDNAVKSVRKKINAKKR